MDEQRRLLKLKYKPGEILVKYEKPNERAGDPDVITFESADKPLKSLPDSLRRMAQHLVDIAELPEPFVDEVKVTGLTFTYNHGVTGIVITGTKELDNSNCPLNLNTPHFTEQPYSETSEDSKNIYSWECARDLLVVRDEVFKFIDGQRAQQELSFSEQQPVEATAS